MGWVGLFYPILHRRLRVHFPPQQSSLFCCQGFCPSLLLSGPCGGRGEETRKSVREEGWVTEEIIFAYAGSGLFVY